MRAFSLVSWVKQQLDGPAWKHRRSRHFFQPQLTVLEDRVAPAAFTVNTFSDTNATDRRPRDRYRRGRISTH
jgi:hypothetical protein